MYPDFVDTLYKIVCVHLVLFLGRAKCCSVNSTPPQSKIYFYLSPAVVTELSVGVVEFSSPFDSAI